MLTPNELIKLLNSRGYDYDFHEHSALFTVEDSNKHRGEIKGLHSKNLFLKNKKNKFYLFSCEEFSEINLKTISKSLNLGNVSFAKKEYLLELLGITPGSVSPFALLNNRENNIDLYIDGINNYLNGKYTLDHEYASQVIEENYSVKAISDKFKELYYEFI